MNDDEPGGPAIMIVLDASGSMEESRCAGSWPDRMTAARWAATSFVQRVALDGGRIGLGTFDGQGARIVCAPGPAEVVGKAVAAVRVAWGPLGSPLGDAMRGALSAVVTSAAAQRELVVITDGAASDPGRVREVLAEAARQGVGVHLIEFCTETQQAAPWTTRSVAREPGELLARMLAAAPGGGERSRCGGVWEDLRGWYRRRFADAGRRNPEAGKERPEQRIEVEVERLGGGGSAVVSAERPASGSAGRLRHGKAQG